MNKTISGYILFFLFLTTFCFSQENIPNIPLNNGTYSSAFQERVFTDIDFVSKNDALITFLSLDPRMNEEKYLRSKAKLESFCKEVDSKKKKKNTLKYLEYVFFKTHKQWLKKYQLNSPFYATLESGEYDCVSGTALYALILDNLAIPFTIKETKFHVYLLVHLNNKTFLIESTDPTDGLISDPVKIKEAENKYIQQQELRKNYYVYKEEVNEKINLKQLAALEFYNDGIASFNNKDILISLNYFEKALKLYNSPRIQDIFMKTLEVLEKQALYTKSVGLAQSYKYYSQIMEK